MKRLWNKRVSAFLLALVMMVSLIPAAAAASADITKSVDAGDDVAIGRTVFRDLFDEESSEDLYYLEFDSFDDFDDYGYFTATDADDDEIALDDSELDDGEFYYSSADVAHADEYHLSTLKFVADDDAEDATLEFEFTLYGDGNDEVEGTLEIEIDGSSSSSSSSSVKLTLEVDADDDVSFDEDDFYDAFDEEYSNDTLSYIKFTGSTDLERYGSLYGYDHADEDDFEIDAEDLTDSRFYYDSDDEEDYLIEDLTYYADDDADGEEVILKFTMYGKKKNELKGTLTIEIGEGSGSSSDGDIEYKVAPSKSVDFDAEDFNEYFQEEYDDYTLDYVVFTDSENLNSASGYIYYNYDKSSEERFTASTLEDAFFYYDEDDAEDDDEYPLDDLTFVAGSSFKGSVTLDFTAYYSSSKKVDGTVVITSSKSASSSSNKTDKIDADILVTVEEDEEVELGYKPFEEFFDDEDLEDFYYVTFTDVSDLEDIGYFYSYYYDEGDDEFYKKKVSEDKLLDSYFYRYDKDVEDSSSSYTLGDLTFVAADDTDGEVVTLEFTVRGESKNEKADGVLCIVIGDVEVANPTTQTGTAKSSILYLSTYNTNTQLNANDFARYFEESYPGYDLQYVKINGVPSVGGLYYNYYGASSYGTAARTKLTASNCDDQAFYLSPSSTSQYALTELTYVPSSTNYCAPISFTAYGSGSRSVTGTVLISVSMKTIPEIYGVVPKNTAISFPAPSIAAAVASGTSSTFSSIQLLELPKSTQGTVYVGSGTTRKADTKTLYSYSNSDTWQISQLRFVPASGYTGSVEIPYVACNSTGTPVAAGKFCLGVVPSVKKFSDVTSTTWCYKYITELASAGVIDGYTDGTYKFNNTVTYGAALKLITLAAGHGEKAPTGSHTFSGYLSYAQQKGWITRSNVNLSGTITRLQVAQLAANAMGLDISSLSSIKPFTDTTDPYVQALNAAGIIEGYFANGTSTYKPGNTLTRGQLSAIVWRMRNYD